MATLSSRHLALAPVFAVSVGLSVPLSVELPAQTYDYAAAAAYSDAHNGHAVLVAIDGQITFEHYANGWTATQPHMLNSCTKSVTGVVMLMAVEDGLLTLNERVADTITEWQNVTWKQDITYRQLLTLSSGIVGGPTGIIPTYAASITQSVFAPPGAQFDYGPYPFQIFGEALRRKLAARQESITDYLMRKVITPLDWQGGTWLAWGTGEPNLPSGLVLTARDFLAFGEMVRLGGVGPHGRMIDANLLDVGFIGTQANPQYGLGWWLTGPNRVAPKDAVSAEGGDIQRCFVIRSHRMVVIRYGDTQTWSDDAFMAALMPAALDAYGNGCAGSFGVPTLAGVGTSTPVLGTALQLQVTAMPSQAIGVFYLGASRDSILGVPLPFPLAMFGMTNCSLLTSAEVALPLAADVTGRAALGFPVPNDRFYSGASLYSQAAVRDLGANAAGLSWSDGLAIRFGVR